MHPTAGDQHPLVERDRAILAFEREWWRYAGARDAAVRDRFGVDPAEYQRELTRLIDRPAALAHDPLLVRRLRRQRATRQRTRSERRRG